MEEVGTKQAPCSRCGELTESELGGVYICQACYEIRSSCCPEFGPDDLAEEVDCDRADDRPSPYGLGGNTISR